MWRFSDPFGRVITDGLSSVPVDPANTDYQRIIASGVEIAPYAKYASLSDSKAGRLAELSDRRVRAEQAFLFGGMPLKLDEATQARISGAIQYLTRNPAVTVPWQVSRGVFVDLGLPQVQALADASGAHVQACFTNARVLATQINAAATIAAVEAVNLDSGWPT